MRDVAEKAHLTPASLYYHFPNKEQLYREAMIYAFQQITGTVKRAIAIAGSPFDKLEAVIITATQTLAKEKDLLRLMQWVKLDRSKERLQEIGVAAFQELYATVYELAAELGSGFDTGLLAMSITGMVIFPFEADEVFRYLPDYRALSNPTRLSHHIMQLLRAALIAE